MEVHVTEDTVVIKNFPLNKFIDDLNKYRYSKILELIRSLTRSKFIFFKQHTIFFPLFFALEFYHLFHHLGKRKFLFKRVYKKIAEEIKEKTWVKNIFDAKIIPRELNLAEIEKRNISLNQYQLNFLHRYALFTRKYNLKGQVLAFEQGLGKTRTAIALALALNKKHILIICPKSLLKNWTDEILNAKEKNISVTPKIRLTKWIVINYEKIRNLGPDILKNIDFLIIDESQYIRNLPAKRTKKIIDICVEYPNINDRLLLSGTPIKKEPEEWIPYFIILNPYINKKLAKLFVTVFLYNKNLANLVGSHRLKMMIARETKEENLRLPEKKIIDLNVYIPDINRYLWPNIMKLINSSMEKYAIDLREKYLNGWNEIEKILRSKGVNREDLYKFIVICLKTLRRKDEISYFNNKLIEWELLLDKVKHKEMLRRMNTLAKNFAAAVFMKTLTTILHKLREECVISIITHNYKEICKIINSTNNKIIIAGTVIKPLIFLKEIIEKYCNVKSLYIDSNTKDRFEALNEFKTNPNVKVLIGTIGVLGIGLTLTEADRMIIVNLPFRWVDVEQMIDRIHRIGQKYNVMIYIVKLNTRELNIHNHMLKIALQSKEEVENMLKLVLMKER